MAWDLDISVDALVSEEERPRFQLVLLPSEQRGWVAAHWDEYLNHEILTFRLPAGYDGEDVRGHVLEFPLSSFEDLDDADDADAHREVCARFERHLERIPQHCRPALTVRQCLDQAADACGLDAIAAELVRHPDYGGCHDDATIVDREDAVEIGRSWLRSHPVAFLRALRANKPGDVAFLVELGSALLEADPDEEDDEEIAGNLFAAARRFEVGSPAALLAEALGLREAA